MIVSTFRNVSTVCEMIRILYIYFFLTLSLHFLALNMSKMCVCGVQTCLQRYFVHDFFLFILFMFCAFNVIFFLFFYILLYNLICFNFVIIYFLMCFCMLLSILSISEIFYADTPSIGYVQQLLSR